MKNHVFSLLLMVICLAAKSQLSNEQEKLYNQVLETSQKRYLALIQGNHKEIDVFFDDSVIMIASHLNQKLNLNQLKNSLVQKKLLYDTLYNLNVNPHFYNNNKMCILTGERQIVYKKPKMEVKIAFSEVFYLNDKNQWKMVYYHSNKVEK
ncbi:MAG: hypothetical protein ORN85_01385 [Sediminibacterium sp.]|nr:hypothetical protein [Sediminibacterium sp.]